MMKLVNTTPEVLKHQIKDAIDQAIETYRKDYPNEKCWWKKFYGYYHFLKKGWFLVRYTD